MNQQKKDTARESREWTPDDMRPAARRPASNRLHLFAPIRVIRGQLSDFA